MLFFAIIASYLIGSIPTAYIFGKIFKGIDIREHGSGNVGATNVFRVLGKGPGILALVLDIIKGVIPVVLIADLFGVTHILGLMAVGCAAVCGHNWTCFLRFKGGKGVATSLGVLIGLTIKIAAIRPLLIIALISWIISFLISRFVSLSSIIAATSLPITAVVTRQPIEIIILGIIFFLFIVIRHQPNIKRLIEGQEPKVPFKGRGSS